MQVWYLVLHGLSQRFLLLHGLLCRCWYQSSLIHTDLVTWVWDWWTARRVMEVAVVGDFREHRRSNNPIKWPLTQLIELLISLFLWQKFLNYILRKCLSRILRSSILAPAHTNHLLIRVEGIGQTMKESKGKVTHLKLYLWITVTGQAFFWYILVYLTSVHVELYHKPGPSILSATMDDGVQ